MFRKSKIEKILKAFEPLLEEAKENGLCLVHSEYPSRWYTPDEFINRIQRDYGTIWNRYDWCLKHPQVKIDSLLQEKERIEREIEKFERVKRPGKS